VGLLQRLQRGPPDGIVQEHIGAAGGQLDNLGIDGGVVVFVGFRGNDDSPAAFEVALHRLDDLATIFVITVEHGDLRHRLHPCDVMNTDTDLGAGDRWESDAPGQLVRGRPPMRACGVEEQVRHLLGIDVIADREVLVLAERRSRSSGMSLLTLRGRDRRGGGRR